ncbi:Hypothetical predicted protein [Prunus dulcis]|uniref:Uncharacterized protein n=1 Tax=Prunus dulcis TaxID=3755 RepID=A0A5E4G8Y0_PRUDU|nr:Hypothetical predicted protein [Prunus dulcis]
MDSPKKDKCLNSAQLSKVNETPVWCRQELFRSRVDSIWKADKSLNSAQLSKVNETPVWCRQELFRSLVDSIWKVGELELQKMGFEDYGNVLLHCVKKIYTLDSVPKGWEFLVKSKS